jgi:hypothetical protein
MNRFNASFQCGRVIPTPASTQFANTEYGGRLAALFDPAVVIGWTATGLPISETIAHANSY